MISISRIDRKIDFKFNGNFPSIVDSEYSSIHSFAYHCNHCEAVFGTANEVYDHWLTIHTTAPGFKPFAFQVFNFASCFHCDYIGIYSALRDHHLADHLNKQFAIVDVNSPKKCAMCEFIGNDMVKHTKERHSIVINENMPNPLALSDQQLIELQSINLREKIKCGHCTKVFETESSFNRHTMTWHGTIAPKPIHGINDGFKLWVECCKQQITESVYLQHFQNHPPSFECVQCNVAYPDINAAIQHDKDVHKVKNAAEKNYQAFKNRFKAYYLSTKVIYGNGLVVSLQNLTATIHNKEKDFDEFISTLVQVKQEKK